MSPNAVILNFARGELVDSDAMKEFLDSGNGRYVTDFPDDVLWDHKNCLVLPHLGASTEEAEDAAVRLEHADFVRLWWGGSQIRNSFCLAVFA
jgi:D-3-phosphoglycerate dehydrogenase